jgi:hypothetical protein
LRTKGVKNLAFSGSKAFALPFSEFQRIFAARLKQKEKKYKKDLLMWNFEFFVYKHSCKFETR